MIKIALVGAGGKMGCRLTDNFLNCPQYCLNYLEISEKGMRNLKERNVVPGDQLEAVSKADVVILAVPDVAIGTISDELIPLMKSGALVIYKAYPY
ncbi:MAG: NAD(P)-binding domain-containing protein [Segetibacter sp.]|jgi:predicted dinucleotide-binding enzyme|nr:NAD(P)-binding domain-containing protein [Segetibacter sp.]